MHSLTYSNMGSEGYEQKLYHTGVVSFNCGNVRASNVSHTVVLRPLKAGYFNFTSATVSYLAQEGGQVVVSPFGITLMDRNH